MDYELALELKNAGFPQSTDTAEERRDSWVCPDGDFGNWQVDDSYIYCPTLSELISACGDKLIGLGRTFGGSFYCKYHDPKPRARKHQKETDRYAIPEEAVARLWLEINKI